MSATVTIKFKRVLELCCLRNPEYYSRKSRRPTTNCVSVFDNWQTKMVKNLDDTFYFKNIDI